MAAMDTSRNRQRAESLAREALRASLRNPQAAAPKSRGPINVASEDFGDLQRLVDLAFAGKGPYQQIGQLDFVILAESQDLSDDVLEVVALLPPGRFDRERLCTHVNSILAGHGWGNKLGTVE